jgi:hypothetical protein
MKTSIIILASLLLSAASHQALAQESVAQPAGPRDLYNTYGKSEHATSPAPATSAAGKPSIGRPGVRVRVELDRDGRARFVSPKTVFHAGDKVRFHFAMNFPGYVAIINQGSSGKRALLFPYEGVSNHIGRTADYTVPQGEGWFAFDNTPGTEQLTFVMSKREIQEVTQVTVGSTHGASPVTTPAPEPEAPAAPVPQSAPTVAAASPAPTAPPAAAPTPQTEEQEILAALNSRSLTGGRDLKMVEENNDGYVLTTDEALAKPVGFRLTLQHR